MNDQANNQVIVIIVFIVFVIIFWLVQTGPHANEKSTAEKRLRKIKQKNAKIKREAEEEKRRLKRHAEEQVEMIRFKSQIWVI